MKRFKAHAYLLVILILNVSLFTGCGTNGETGKWLPDGKAPTTSTTTPATPATPTTPTTPVSSDTTAPRVTSTVPAHGDRSVSVDTEISATFNEAMDPSTINTRTFTLWRGDKDVAGVVTYSGKTAYFTPDYGRLLMDSIYTGTITTGVKDLAGNPMAVDYVWVFTTPRPALTPGELASVNILGGAARFGNLSGAAGTTNTGIFTTINGGDLGSTATATGSVTGFHDSAADIYTETGANVGGVGWKILTCTTSTTGPTCAVCIAPLTANPVSCGLATVGLADANTAYNTLRGLPAGSNPGGNLAGMTLAAGTYTTPGGFLIQGGDLTLNGGGDANAVFIFQIGTTLTIGGPGAAAPQNVNLINGAQAKNVYWQIGSAAIINAGGGGTIQGTILAGSSIAISTAGSAIMTTLNGRAIALGASVTMVNTTITVP